MPNDTSRAGGRGQNADGSGKTRPSGADAPHENPWTRMRLEREQAARNGASERARAASPNRARNGNPTGARAGDMRANSSSAQANGSTAAGAAGSSARAKGTGVAAAHRDATQAGRGGRTERPGRVGQAERFEHANRTERTPRAERSGYQRLAPPRRGPARETFDGCKILSEERSRRQAADSASEVPNRAAREMPTRQAGAGRKRRNDASGFVQESNARSTARRRVAAEEGGASTTRRQAASARTPESAASPAGRAASRVSGILRSTPPFVIAGVILAVVVLAIVGFFAISHFSGQTPEPASQPQPVVADSQQGEAPAATPETVDFTPTPQALDSIPAGEDIQAFSLSDLSAPEIPQDAMAAIEQAANAAAAQGSVSFVFYDLESGRGIARDADTAVYGASSFKGPYAVYVCEDLIEGGTIALSTMCPVSYALDAGSYYGNSGHSAYPVSELIEAAVINSDNNAFGFLRDSYDSVDFDAWVTGVGADDAVYTPSSWFPWYCARSSAKLWTETYDYLQSGTETADWLADVMGQTEISFIRDGLAQAEGGADATVRDKAGWCADADPDYNSVSDAGIIEADGHAYIMSIMTGAPDSDENRALVSDIARALFEARDSLNLKG